MFKKLSLMMAFAVVLLIGITVVGAAGITPTTPQPVFTDGRLNAYDAGAPIVVYEPRVNVPVVQANGLPGTTQDVGRVEILSWDGVTQTSSLALMMSADDINKAIAKHPGKDFIISTQHGVSLGYSHLSGFLWVTAPPDFEGKTYTFSWLKNF